MHFAMIANFYPPVLKKQKKHTLRFFLTQSDKYWNICCFFVLHIYTNTICPSSTF